MKLSLVVLNAGKSSGQAIPIDLAQFTIGRDPQCNLRPASAMISKRHCAVINRNGQLYVRDFDSTNGTFLNDQPVKGEVAVKHGDVLKAGPLSFKISVEQTATAKSPAVAKPTPAPSTTKPVAAPQPVAAARSGTGDDDSIADLLLSLPGEEGSGSAAGGDEVPAGSTVMDLKPLLTDGAPAPAAETKEEKSTATPHPPGKAPEKKPEKKEEKKVDTAHLAAKAILEKYSRRPRGSA